MTNRKSYEDYVEHQASKLPKMRGRLDKHDAAFSKALTTRLGKPSSVWLGKSVLCLGARRGAEVKVFRDLGCFAWGIDLNPGEKNRYVTVGDFQALDFKPECVDVVYTNSLDHAYYLLGVLHQIHKVLKPHGLFISEIVHGTKEGIVFDSYAACTWDKIEDVFRLIKESGFRPSKVARVAFDAPWPGVQALWIKE